MKKYITKPIIRGDQRTGYHASDLLAALTDVAEAEKQDAQVEKAEVLVRTLRFIGPSPLEARDGSLYEKLVAAAREDGFDKEEHVLPLSTVVSMHGDPNVRRVEKSLKRLSTTRVRWDILDADFQRNAEVPLLLVETVKDLKAGTAMCHYSIPLSVRRVMLRAREYANLEVAAISKFRSRYTIRLYEKLALHAQLGDRHEEPWTVSPEELAEMVGWAPKAGFNYGTFKRDVLGPTVEDLNAHVTRFRLKQRFGHWYEEGYEPGRGRRVVILSFRVTRAVKAFQENQAAPLSPGLKGWHQRPDERHTHGYIPSDLTVGRAVTVSGRDEVEVSNGWRAALDRAVTQPDEELAPGLTGYELLAEKDARGLQGAMAMWLAATAGEDRLDTERVPVPEGRKLPMPEGLQDVPPPVPSADDRRERTKVLCVNAAQTLIWQLEGWKIDPAYGVRANHPASVIDAYCDGDVAPWAGLSNEWMHEAWQKAHGQVGEALRVLRTVADDRRRGLLKVMAQAVVDWDADKLAGTARAVLANKDKFPRRLPPPVARKAYVPEVNEETAGEFHDPRLVAGHYNWSDRDLSDDIADAEAA